MMAETQPERYLPHAGVTTLGRQNYAWEFATLAALKQADEGMYEFEARFPEVVGYVPAADRAAYDALAHPGAMRVPARGDVVRSYEMILQDCGLATHFPGIHRVIWQDLQSLGVEAPDWGASDEVAGLSTEVGRTYTEAGSRPGGRWHVEGNRSDDRNLPYPVAYLVNNRQGTEFFAGRVKAPNRFVPTPHGMAHFLLEAFPDAESGTVVSAPDWSIVRLGPLTVHKARIFTESVWRTHARATMQPSRHVMASAVDLREHAKQARDQGELTKRVAA